MADASSSTGPADMNGAKGSLNSRTLQSVEQETATSPLGAMEIPFTAPDHHRDMINSMHTCSTNQGFLLGST